MLNYVTTVLISNGAGAVFAPASGHEVPTTADAGKFVVMNCDANIGQDELYDASIVGRSQVIKVGFVTDKKLAVYKKNQVNPTYEPIIKWSNEIKAADIKSYTFLDHTKYTQSEDTVTINLSSITSNHSMYSKGEARIIVRLTFKDMPHRYRKWTESYEYDAAVGETGATIAAGIANIINNEYKRARVKATVSGNNLVLEARPYDDDNTVDSISPANKVRFNANIYYTKPGADGWESGNKYFPAGVTVTKAPGVQYPAEAKLVRDREFWGMGYQGILNRGEGTWPIIKPEMQTNLSNTYDGLTLEFENMYRAADDIQRKTKQVLEIYGTNVSNIKNVLDTFVQGVQQDELTNPKLTPTL